MDTTTFGKKTELGRSIRVQAVGEVCLASPKNISEKKLILARHAEFWESSARKVGSLWSELTFLYKSRVVMFYESEALRTL